MLCSEPTNRLGLLPWGVPNKILTVQDRWTWCCWVMMIAKGVRARPTSSSAWVSDTSVLRKIRSTTMPKSRTFRPTVSAYSLQLFFKQKYTEQTHAHTKEHYEMKTCHVRVEDLSEISASHFKLNFLRERTYFWALFTTITEQSTGRSVS